MPPTTPQDHRKTAKKTAKPKKAKEPKQPQVEASTDPNDPYAITAWGSGPDNGLVDLKVPSGQLCLVKRPGLENLMKAGILRDMDTLTLLVNEKVAENTGQGKKTSDPDSCVNASVAAMFTDPEQIAQIMHTVDRAVVECVVKPPIYMTPNDATSRKSGVIYTDMVDIIDKMFTFNYVVGGSSDLEQFREEHAAAVGDLDTLQAAAVQA